MKGLLYLLVIIPTLFNFTQSRIITLEDIGDQETGVWTEISCRHYLDSAEYMSAKGCYASATNLTDHRWKPENETDDFFDGNEGFWGPCSKQTCEIIYYGGFLPQPLNISIFGLFSGDGTVEVLTRRGASYGDWRLINTLRASDTTDTITTDWVPLTVDDSELMQTDYVFKFVVTTTPLSQSLALIDRIEIDLGPDVLEPPTTTTENPLNPDPKDVFELNVREELTGDSEWMSVSCNYAETPEDFWVYGCPNNVTSMDDEEDHPLGFWTTCHAYNCDFIFSSGAGRPQIQLLSMEGLFRGDAKVSVSKKSRGALAKYEHVLSVTAADFSSSTSWAKIIPNYCNSDIYNISISGASNNILVDKIVVALYEDSDVCTTPVATEPTSSTTPASGTGATDPDDKDKETTTKKSAAPSISATLMTLVFFVCTSLSFSFY